MKRNEIILVTIIMSLFLYITSLFITRHYEKTYPESIYDMINKIDSITNLTGIDYTKQLNSISNKQNSINNRLDIIERALSDISYQIQTECKNPT